MLKKFWYSNGLGSDRFGDCYRTLMHTDNFPVVGGEYRNCWIHCFFLSFITDLIFPHAPLAYCTLDNLAFLLLPVPLSGTLLSQRSHGLQSHFLQVCAQEWFPQRSLCWPNSLQEDPDTLILSCALCFFIVVFINKF